MRAGSRPRAKTCKPGLARLAGTRHGGPDYPIMTDVPLRILIVEDEAVVAFDLAGTIGAMGFEIVGPATSLAGGRELLHAVAPDGALLDINVGGEAVYPLARDCLDRGLPIAFVTAMHPANIPQEMQAVPRLAKPWTMPQLRRLMLTVFGQDERTRLDRRSSGA
jgi:response regulator of citrate/malate metabolism